MVGPAQRPEHSSASPSVGDGGSSLDPDRWSGALLGLACGDALGAPTENLTRAEINARYGWLDEFGPTHEAGTDDTEFAVLTAMTVLSKGRDFTSADVAQAWRMNLLGQREEFRTGGFSELGALAALRRGLEPPASGTDHHEPFSDGAAMRATPCGMAWPGRPNRAAALAAQDAAVSHSRDGIWCAQAVATGVSVALTCNDCRVVVGTARQVLPEDSWSRELTDRALAAASTCTGPDAAAADTLVESVAIAHYPWTDLAPEAFALALACVQLACGEPIPAIVLAANLGRDADTIAAMAGALTGAWRGAEALPAEWRERCGTVHGVCIRATAGTSLPDLSTRLYERVIAWESGA